MLLFRRLIVGDGYFRQRESGDRRHSSDEVEKHHGLKTERRVQEYAEHGRADARGARKGLIERVDAHEMLFRH